jgi:hypothetical protein
MEFSIEIHFLPSRSKAYPDVLKHARLFFQFSDNPNILKITDVDELFGRWDDFSIVIFNATKWAGTNVFFCGKPVLPYRNDFFYTLQETKTCYSNFQIVCDKEGFCMAAPWGCHRIKSLEKKITGLYGNFWYRYGHFLNEDTWAVDKERILKILTEEAKLKMLDICPGFDVERIRHSVNKLPEMINLDENWEIEYKADITSDGMFMVPESIHHKFIEPPKIAPGGLNIRINQVPDKKLERDEINDFLDQLLEQKKKKENPGSGKWEETSF